MKKKRKHTEHCKGSRKFHEWETIHSYGYWSMKAQCVRCGKIATFIIREGNKP